MLLAPRNLGNSDDRGGAGAFVAVALGVALLLAAGAVVLGVAWLLGRGDEARIDTIYVSLGDSVAAGSGASDPAATSFPALLASEHDVTLLNLAVAGATTRDVIERQLARAITLTEAGQARFVTVSAGGNDLATLIPNAACAQDPLPAACPLDEAIAGVERNLDTIVGYVRDSNARVPVVLLAYPDFFSGTGHEFEAPASRVLPRLAEAVQRVAARHERVAVARPDFDGRGGDFTHLLDPAPDPHPNDAGHRVIAAAVEAALRDLR